MFYSEVMAKNVASEIRQVLHRKNGTEGCIIVFLETRHEMFSMSDHTWNNF